MLSNDMPLNITTQIDSQIDVSIYLIDEPPRTLEILNWFHVPSRQYNRIVYHRTMFVSSKISNKFKNISFKEKNLKHFLENVECTAFHTKIDCLK